LIHFNLALAIYTTVSEARKRTIQPSASASTNIRKHLNAYMKMPTWIYDFARACTKVLLRVHITFASRTYNFCFA